MSAKAGTDNTRAESILDEKDGLYITDREEVIIEQPTEEEKATLRRVADQISRREDGGGIAPDLGNLGVGHGDLRRRSYSHRIPWEKNIVE